VVDDQKENASQVVIHLKTRPRLLLSMMVVRREKSSG
jgi:hypothetical protein